MRSRNREPIIFLFVCLSTHALAQTGIPKRSDVLFPNIEEAQELHSFEADMTVWGFMASIHGNFDTSRWKHSVKDHHNHGLSIHGRVEWDLNWEGILKRHPEEYEKAACHDFDGKPIYFPWNDQEFWFCNHQPIFQEYLKFQIRLALSAKPDGLLFDSQTGTPTSYGRGGCFCDRCMANFPKWLSEHFTAAELGKWEIDDISTWNYHHHLKDQGWTWEKYKSRVSNGSTTIPLANEYRLFQKEYLNQLVRDLISYAQERAGYELAISCSSPLYDAYYAGVRMVHLPEIDFYSQEYNHRIDSLKLPDHLVMLYKIAEAMDKPLVVTAQPEPDWFDMHHSDRVNLSWSWIAQAYANGANFIVPRRMWGYNGTNHVYFEGKLKGYKKIYQLMVAHPELFDDYEAVSHVGLLYVHQAYRQYDKTVDRIAAEMMLQNIPFRLEIAGDQWWPKYLEAGRLKELDAIVVHRKLLDLLDEKQRAVLNTVKHKWVKWDSNDMSAMDKRLSREIRMTAQNVSAFPRHKRNDADAPYVLHLLNRNYRADEDTFEIQNHFKVTLSNRLFGGFGTKAFYYTPGSQEPIKLEILRNEAGQSYTFVVPALNHWGIVKIRQDSPADEPGYSP